MSTKLIATAIVKDNNYTMYLESIGIPIGKGHLITWYWVPEYTIYRNDVLIYKDRCHEDTAKTKFNSIVDSESSLTTTIDDFNKGCTNRAMNWFNNDY